MNMLVCVKQVPDTTEIKIDPVTNTLIRAGVPSILNPFDGYALEAAARIKDADPSAKIVVLSMGPEQAKAVLKESLAIAADKAYLVSDRAFGGSDTLATSYIISETIKKVEELEGKFDIIFCGTKVFFTLVGEPFRPACVRSMVGRSAAVRVGISARLAAILRLMVG